MKKREKVMKEEAPFSRHSRESGNDEKGTDSRWWGREAFSQRSIKFKVFFTWQQSSFDNSQCPSGNSG
jgi:hypothetical protein